jgi:deoxyribose-phosphate aldolase
MESINYDENDINSIDEKEQELKTRIDNVLEYPIANILVQHNQIKFIKKNYPKLNIGCFIDYPLAFNDIDIRQQSITSALSCGANFISITIPFYYIINRKYAKFRDDIKKNFDLCNSHNASIRYILEYRKFDHQILTKVCEILIENNVNTIYPSTGLFLDNIEDNIIACAYLNKKTGISTIINGNIWNSSQLKTLLKVQPFGLSINQTATLGLLDTDIYK